MPVEQVQERVPSHKTASKRQNQNYAGDEPANVRPDGHAGELPVRIEPSGSDLRQ